MIFTSVTNVLGMLIQQAKSKGGLLYISLALMTLLQGCGSDFKREWDDEVFVKEKDDEPRLPYPASSNPSPEEKKSSTPHEKKKPRDIQHPPIALSAVDQPHLQNPAIQADEDLDILIRDLDSPSCRLSAPLNLEKDLLLRTVSQEQVLTDIRYTHFPEDVFGFRPESISFLTERFWDSMHIEQPRPILQALLNSDSGSISLPKDLVDSYVQEANEFTLLTTYSSVSKLSRKNFYIVRLLFSAAELKAIKFYYYYWSVVHPPHSERGAGMLKNERYDLNLVSTCIKSAQITVMR